MVEEFDLHEEEGIPFEEADCIVPAWYNIDSCDSLFYQGKPESELTLVFKEEGILYFIVSDMKEFSNLCEKYDWYIVTHQPFNELMEIGLCLMEAEKYKGWYSLGKTSERNTMFRDVLYFTFDKREKVDFYPYETIFKGKCIIDGCPCHYLHDYYPTREKKMNGHQKRVSNMIFRFKEGGYCGELVAHILSLSLKQAGFINNKENTVLIPIPASTMERQRKRFPAVCYYLSKWVGIMDGFRAIWIREDREQTKGKGKGKDVLSNLQYSLRYIKGKHVILLDDILTTGESFRQLQRKMKELGAISVTGVFLGKTIYKEDYKKTD